MSSLAKWENIRVKGPISPSVTSKNQAEKDDAGKIDRVMAETLSEMGLKMTKMAKLWLPY